MLPGAHRVIRRKSGRVYLYWYAYRGRNAPQLGVYCGTTLQEVQEKERLDAKGLAAAYAQLASKPLRRENMAYLIKEYEANRLPQLAPSTQRVWGGHIAEINEVFGKTSLRAMQARGTRSLIKKWHLGMGAQPRTANYRLTVLVAILSWGIDEQIIDSNPAHKIERLDEGIGRADVVWSPDELTALLSNCKPEVARAVRLAALTGLRLSDTIGLNWSDITPNAIRRRTQKSRKKQTAVIRRYPALDQLLAECPKIGPKVITNSRGKPWKNGDSFDSSFRQSLKACGVDKHFHDLRGTAATQMYIAGLSLRDIGIALGLSEAETEPTIRKYIDIAGIAERSASV